MTEPKQPRNPPTEGKPLDTNPSGTTPNGIPDGMEDAEPMGHPNSDRHNTEKSPGE